MGRGQSHGQPRDSTEIRNFMITVLVKAATFQFLYPLQVQDCDNKLSNLSIPKSGVELAHGKLGFHILTLTANT